MKSKYRHPSMVMQKLSIRTDPDTKRFALMYDPTHTLDPRQFIVAGKQILSDLKAGVYPNFTVFRLYGTGTTHRFIVFGNQLWRISHLPYDIDGKEDNSRPSALGKNDEMPALLSDTARRR